MSHSQRVLDLNEMSQVKSLLNGVLRDTSEVVRHQHDQLTCTQAIFIARCNANLARMYLGGLFAPLGTGMLNVDQDGSALGQTSVDDGESGSVRLKKNLKLFS